MANESDFRAHLLITESDVIRIDDTSKPPFNNRGLDPFEHGSTLSSGLESVLEAYTRIQSSDSLSDEDIRLFEVVLPEGEKFSTKTMYDFLAAEGMTVNSVRDQRHAIVSTTQSQFETLRKRIGMYTSQERKFAKFQGIEGFRFPDPMDKQAPSLQELIRSKMAEIPVDVEIQEHQLTGQIGAKGQANAEKRLIADIQAKGGSIVSNPFQLSDGTPVIRAKIPVGQLRAISEHTVICRVAPTGFYGTAPAACIPAQNPVYLNPQVSLDDLPIVVVLDTGVRFPPELADVVIEHWTPTDAEPSNDPHGTFVASKVAFADVGNQMFNGIMTPRARIIDCNIRGRDPHSDSDRLISDQTMILRIKEAVLRYKDISKIFNLSSAAEVPIQGDEISLLAYELDDLSREYGVKFVLATGNHRLYETQDSLEEILQDDDIQIAAPADAMLNISVGAIVGMDNDKSISKRMDVAPYSRIGPGFRGFRKPDLVTFCATVNKKGNTLADPYAFVIGENGTWGLQSGTSLAAPVVAGDLAEITRFVPEHDILLAETLLYHGAELPILSKKKISRDENAFYGNLYGRGISMPMSSMFSTPDRVTFLHRGTMSKRQKQHVKFLMPGICSEKLDMKKRNKKINVIVTCVTQPPINPKKGEEYLSAYVEASLHSINGNGKLVPHNPPESDGRKEWDTCYHFYLPYSSFSNGDWEVWLELHTRYDIDEAQEIDYALAITIEDLTHTLHLYDSIVEEAKGRFPAAVQMVRLPVRM